jgi:hypothetical protein
MVEEWRDAPTPSGRVKTRVQCSGLCVGSIHDKTLTCNQCGTVKENPYYRPATAEPIHEQKKVEY